MMIRLAGTIMTGFGAVFLFLGSLGILRLPDVYNRLQAGTKCTTMGAFCVVAGVGMMEPSWFFKTLLIALFVLVTNPISSHALGRASCRAKVPRCKETSVDKTREFRECAPE